MSLYSQALLYMCIDIQRRNKQLEHLHAHRSKCIRTDEFCEEKYLSLFHQSHPSVLFISSHKSFV